MLEILKTINNDYATVLTMLISFITGAITLAYVIFTYKQMKFTEKSVNVMKNQLSLQEQPCVLPSIIKGSSDAALDNGRRWLKIEFNLKNIGLSPAISVFSVCYLKLKYTSNNGCNIVPMSSAIEYLPSLAATEEKTLYLSFENKEIKCLLDDLEVCHFKNMERLRTNPYLNHYRGTDFVIKVFSKNILGQWFETKLEQEIAWLHDPNSKRVSNNINENTIPPCKLFPQDNVEVVFSWLNNSRVNTRPIDKIQVDKTISQFSEHQPELIRLLDEDKSCTL